MSEWRRTGIKLALASAVVALTGFGIGLAAAPPDDLPERVVAVGQVNKRVVTVSDHSGGHHEGRCELKRGLSAAPPAI